MRVLVCGGRGYGEIPNYVPRDQQAYWTDRAAREAFEVRETLYVADRDHRFTCVINGGAKGADRHAKKWAEVNSIPVETFKARWRQDGNKAAGPIRNQRMIDEGKPDLVIAFPGGKGTADMVRRARAAGIPVQEVAAPVWRAL